MTYPKNFEENTNTTSKVFAKKSFQTFRKDAIHHGYEVIKVDSGYCFFEETEIGEKVLVLKAMNGLSGYLVRYDTDTFSL